jgi:hypothetical protein
MVECDDGAVLVSSAMTLGLIIPGTVGVFFRRVQRDTCLPVVTVTMLQKSASPKITVQSSSPKLAS